MSGKTLDSSNLEMTNFEWYTKDIQNLTRLLEAVRNDALEAEGCVLNVTLPPSPTGDPDDIPRWEDWLAELCDFYI